LEKESVSGIMLISLLVGMLTLAFNVQSVKGAWTGTVYIRADGSIDPPDAPIITYDNLTYTLTDNITTSGDGIVVERDNIIIDGMGYAIEGPGLTDYKGINLAHRTNVTIKNVKITNSIGVYLFYSSNSRILGNIIVGNHVGIAVEEDSPNNTIIGNIITENDPSGISLFGSSSNSIHDNYVTNNWIGIELTYASNNTVVGNNIAYNSYGMELYKSEDNKIFGNTITENTYWAGIKFDYSSNNNSVVRNNVTNNWVGIDLYGEIIGSSQNIVYENNIQNNQYGIMLTESENNKFYHNNFIDNEQQVYIYTSGYVNIWDDGYPSGGNYWSDYTGVDEFSGPNQNQPGSDGIGDTPYVIDENNQDNYPLMEPWTPAPPPGASADLIRRAAWPEHRHFVLSKDGDPSVEDRHGTSGNQTLYGLVENTGNVTLPAGTYKVVWNITTEIGYVIFVETIGTIPLQPGEITQLTYDVPAEELPLGKYYVKAQAYYYGTKGEKTKTFSFTVVP